MSNDRITSLEALRKRKEMLRKELDEGFTSPFDNLKNMLGKYTSGETSPTSIFDKSETGRNQLMDEGVKAILTLVASTAVTRFKLGPVPKLLLTSAVAIATPYVVDRIQSYIRRKMK